MKKNLISLAAMALSSLMLSCSSSEDAVDLGEADPHQSDYRAAGVCQRQQPVYDEIPEDSQ